MSKQGTWSSNWWAAWRSKEEELTYCQGAFVGWQEEIPQVWRWKWWHTENLPYICPYITSSSSSSLPVPVAVAVNFSHHRYHHLNMPVFFSKTCIPLFSLQKIIIYPKSHHPPCGLWAIQVSIHLTSWLCHGGPFFPPWPISVIHIEVGAVQKKLRPENKAFESIWITYWRYMKI